MLKHGVFCELVAVLSYADVPRLTQFPVTQFQTRNFTESKRKIEIRFVSIAPKFSGLQ